MVWAAVIPAVAALAGSAMQAYGASRANSTNRDIASAQMAFQAGESQASQQFAYDMWQRNAELQDKYYNRNFDFQAEQAARQELMQKWSINNAQSFAEHMSNTSYQRGVVDMRKAGLNPILAYRQGGATAPTIGTASGPSSSAPGAPGPVGAIRPAMSGASTRVENTLSGVVSTAVQGAKIVGELQQMAANLRQTDAQTNLIGEQQAQVRSNTALQTAQAITEGVRPSLIQAQTRTEQGRPALVGAQAASASASARRVQQETDITTRWGPGGQIRNVGEGVESIARRLGGFFDSVLEGAGRALRLPEGAPPSQLSPAQRGLYDAHRRFRELIR